MDHDFLNMNIQNRFSLYGCQIPPGNQQEMGGPYKEKVKHLGLIANITQEMMSLYQ